jgi:hypothetical protein
MRYTINSFTAKVILIFTLLAPTIIHTTELGAPEIEQRLESNIEPTDFERVKYKEDQISLDRNYVLNLHKLDAKLFCVAQNNFFEARGESLMGKIAVAEVVRNRTESGKYPNDSCAVVQQVTSVQNTRVCQFSWFCKGLGKIPLLNRNGEVNASVYRQWYDSVLAAIKVQSRDEPDVVGGATHFYAHRLVKPRWGGGLIKVKVIGNHTFMGPRN